MSITEPDANMHKNGKDIEKHSRNKNYENSKTSEQ
jgi:hypothetical protein